VRALEITDEREARVYFEELVQRALGQMPSFTREEAESHVKSSIAYYAGYYDNDVRARVERLYNCVHPFFGSIEKNGPPGPEAAYRMGQAAAMGQLTELVQPKDPKMRSLWERIIEDDTVQKPRPNKSKSRT
jgi:hypothetical protein